MAVLIATMVCVKLVYLEHWLTDNDNYITLSTFFSSSGRDDYVQSARRLYEASVAACAPDHMRRCVAYAGALLGEQTYSRPITAFFGSRLVDARWLSSEREFLTGITKATVLLIGTGAALVVVLMACFLTALPRSLAAFLAATLALFGIVACSLPEHTAFSAFQPLFGVGGAGAIGVVGLALAIWPLSRQVPRFWPGWATLPTERARPVFWWIAAVLLATRAVAHQFPALYFGASVLGSRVGLLILLLSVVGIAAFLAAMAYTARSNAIPAGASWVALFLIFGFVSPGETFFTTIFHIAPRGHIYLLAAPIVVYAALKPNGYALWLLPALALFHIPMAGVLGGCLAATELLACLRRRSLSLALVLSAVVLVLAAIHTVTTGGNPVVAPSADSMGVVAARLDALGLLPGIVVLTILGVAAYVAWHMPDPRGDLLLRAVVLAALLAGAGQLRHALELSGFDLLDPAAFNFILFSLYLAPAVCAAGIFLVMIGLAARAGSEVGPGLEIRGVTLSILLAAVLALAAARAGNHFRRPENPLSAIARGAALVVSQIPPHSIDPLVVEAAAPNDRYLVGPSVGGAVTMMSILKMKARTAAGLLKPDSVSIVVVGRPR
jgi:hypothetical protein